MSVAEAPPARRLALFEAPVRGWFAPGPGANVTCGLQVVLFGGLPARSGCGGR